MPAYVDGIISFVVSLDQLLLLLACALLLQLPLPLLLLLLDCVRLLLLLECVRLLVGREVGWRSGAVLRRGRLPQLRSQEQRVCMSGRS
jgi:hypothetical protein